MITFSGQRYDYPGAFLFALGLALCLIAYDHTRERASVPSLSPMVRVDIADSGHGSAVHIGHGLFITAAHVVPDGAKATINGEPAEVLWTNISYDVALIKANAKVGVADLNCAPVKPGTTVRIYGNPKDMGRVETRGTIASETPYKVEGMWKHTVIVDATVLSGMSGGPVFGEDGRVVGITVGMRMDAPLNIVVPSSVICTLLGRA